MIISYGLSWAIDKPLIDPEFKKAEEKIEQETKECSEIEKGPRAVINFAIFISTANLTFLLVLVSEVSPAFKFFQRIFLPAHAIFSYRINFFINFFVFWIN